MPSLFELGRTDGPGHRAWAHRAAPDLELDWSTLTPERWDPVWVESARRSWSENAFNEYCTATAMAELLEVLLALQAPLDLVGMVTTFLREEVVHVQLCAGVVTRLGGALPIEYEPDDLRLGASSDASPWRRAHELVLRICCVGEAFSLPMLRGTLRCAEVPAIRTVLERIVQDEGAHGTFGEWWFDWAGPSLTEADRRYLSVCARDAIDHIRDRWPPRGAPEPRRPAGTPHLAAMPPTLWFETAERAMAGVERSLQARGLLA